MKGIIISESLVIRKGVAQILEEEDTVKSLNEGYMCKDINKGKYDLVIFDLNKNRKEYLNCIKEVKQKTDAKVMILDFYEDMRLFSKCMKIGVDSYILPNIEGESIKYAVKLLSKGKKYFDSDLVESYMKKDNINEIKELTKRENEILLCISKGKSNQEIATDLCITEHTVKKHTSNIFEKLNLRDRTHAALYAHEIGII
ncbi:response regulator transcription factor [Terrisporobacter glycolicus]|uniref:Stage 0 sporulation protein A homolog n=1 Tax=Terrisporobacter glycolicus ATCC 14880 = DSM 1288 TaxID=1121315 RepID=A0ABZ2ES59_9FIRM|nr:response regulator transcription factor [Terrisporobacter glycolicus]